MGGVTYQHHLPDPQGYAVAQEQARHDGALFAYGEYSMFVLMWRSEDHEAGLVDRCLTCFEAYGKIAKAYGQSPIKDCPECFGTTFEGGFKARLVRESLWDFNEPANRVHVRGEVEVATASIQSTSDFRMRTGDHIFRGDGTRWTMRTIGTNHLRTGFGMPGPDRTPLGYNFGQVDLQDRDHVVYSIPPEGTTLAARLDVTGTRLPVDYTDLEIIRGPIR